MLPSIAPDARQDDRELLDPMLSRYAARYYLSGPEKDALVSQTLLILANDPDALADGPVEKAIAETMHRVYLTGTHRS